jgi:hypothetical protein
MGLKTLVLLTLATSLLQRATPSVVRPEFKPLEAVVRTMNWPDFEQPATTHAREVRITDWYPNYAGAQVPFLRLVDNGTRFDAQLFVWWPKQHSPLMPVAGTGIRCGDDTDSKAVCVKAVAVPVGYDWDTVAAKALSLKEPCWPEVWMPPATPGTLPPGSGGGVGDAGHLLIDTLAGGTRRTYSCNAPTSGSPNWPVDRAALDMYTLLQALGRATPSIR